MNKVIGCLVVALVLGMVLVIDVRSVAPPWTIYMEWTGLFLAFLAAILYYMSYRRQREKEEDGSIYDDED